MGLKIAYLKEAIAGEAKQAGMKPVRLSDAELFAREMNDKFYKRACKRRAADIEEIQKYFPGWMPAKE